MRRSHDMTGTPRWWRSELCQEALATCTVLAGVVVIVLLSGYVFFRVTGQMPDPDRRILEINGGDHLADGVFGGAPCAVICRDPTGGKSE